MALRAPRRRNAYAQAAYALGSGVRVAYRAAPTVRKVVADVKAALGKRKTGGRSTGVRPPRRKTQNTNRTSEAISNGEFAQTGNELSTTRRTVGRYPALRPQRLLKLMQAGMTSTILRAQGLTNFDTSVGYYPLANRENPTGNVNMPINVWDLTSYLNTGPATAGWGYYWTSQLATADVATYALRTQMPDGTTNTAGVYYTESSGGIMETSNTYQNATKACHEWTDVRLNLYGARKRGTTFHVDFVRVKDALAHPIAAAGTNESKKELFRTLQSPLIYSNLQQHNGKNIRRSLQYVKRYKVYVPGGSTSDLDTIGKIKEVRFFLKQGCVYNMAWEAKDGTSAIPHTQEDGLDYTQNSGPQNHPFTSSRLLMIISAFSPERKVDNNFGQNAADPLTEPSYDMVLRNKWMLPN